MPLSREDRARYDEGHAEPWDVFSARIRFERAGGRCECEGECGVDHGGRCEARHGQPHPVTGSKVVLTVAHRNHVPQERGEHQVFAGCQGCHLRYDREHHAANRKARAEVRKAAERERVKRVADVLGFQAQCGIIATA